MIEAWLRHYTSFVRAAAWAPPTGPGSDPTGIADFRAQLCSTYDHQWRRHNNALTIKPDHQVEAAHRCLPQRRTSGLRITSPAGRRRPGTYAFLESAHLLLEQRANRQKLAINTPCVVALIAPFTHFEQAGTLDRQTCSRTGSTPDQKDYSELSLDR